MIATQMDFILFSSTVVHSMYNLEVPYRYPQQIPTTGMFRLPSFFYVQAMVRAPSAAAEETSWLLPVMDQAVRRL
jgi:hypothetical protein